MWSQLTATPSSSSDDDRRRFPPPPPPGASNHPPPPMHPPQQGGMFPPPPPPPSNIQQHGHQLHQGNDIHRVGSSDHDSYHDDYDGEDDDDGALGATINLVTSAASMFFKKSAAPPQASTFPPPPPPQQQQQQQQQPEQKGPPAPIEPISSMLDNTDINNSNVQPVPPSNPHVATATTGRLRGGSVSSTGKPPAPMFRPPSNPPTPQGPPITTTNSFGSSSGARVSPMPSPYRPQQYPPAVAVGSPHIPTPASPRHTIMGNSPTGSPVVVANAAATSSPRLQTAMFPPPTQPTHSQSNNISLGSGPPRTIPSLPMQPNLQKQQPSPRPAFPPPQQHEVPIMPSSVNPPRPAPPVAQSIFGQPPPTSTTTSQPNAPPAQDSQSMFGQPPPTSTKETNSMFGKPPSTPIQTDNSMMKTNGNGNQDNVAAASFFAPTVSSLQTIDNTNLSASQDQSNRTANIHQQPKATPPNSAEKQAKQSFFSEPHPPRHIEPSSPRTPLITNHHKVLSSDEAAARAAPSFSAPPPTPLHQPVLPDGPAGPEKPKEKPFSTATPVRRQLRAPPPVSKTVLSLPAVGNGASNGESSAIKSRSKFRLPTPRKRVTPLSATKKKREEQEAKPSLQNETKNVEKKVEESNQGRKSASMPPAASSQSTTESQVAPQPSASTNRPTSKLAEETRDPPQYSAPIAL